LTRGGEPPPAPDTIRTETRPSQVGGFRAPYATQNGRILNHAANCNACPSKPRCTRGRDQGRQLTLPAREQHEALAAARVRENTEQGRRLYAQRQGVEGTISQGVRGFGLRQARYRGLTKTGLQSVATAAAFNLDRLAAWFAKRPLAPTRVSRFAAMAA